MCAPVIADRVDMAGVPYPASVTMKCGESDDPRIADKDMSGPACSPGGSARRG